MTISSNDNQFLHHTSDVIFDFYGEIDDVFEDQSLSDTDSSVSCLLDDADLEDFEKDFEKNGENIYVGHVVFALIFLVGGSLSFFILFWSTNNCSIT